MLKVNQIIPTPNSKKLIFTSTKGKITYKYFYYNKYDIVNKRFVLKESYIIYVLNNISLLPKKKLQITSIQGVGFATPKNSKKKKYVVFLTADFITISRIGRKKGAQNYRLETYNKQGDLEEENLNDSLTMNFDDIPF